ncbi:MAG: hypothetical protein HY908_03510, partial [Myxococcales bacterium]|nr:hypothetical protein [Myxococcales bacterium]
GHGAPSAAAAFLRLARTRTAAPAARDPLPRAYFRNLARTPAPAAPAPAAAPDLVPLLRAAGVVEPPPGLLPASSAPREPLFVTALRRLAAADPELFDRRAEELAYLANVLAAGCPVRGRRLRPAEAVKAALATCDHGLRLAMGRGTRAGQLDAALRVLREQPADALFRLAWPEVHGRVEAGDLDAGRPARAATTRR